MKNASLQAGRRPFSSCNDFDIMKCKPYLSTHLWETTRSPLFSPLKISSFFCFEVNKLSEQLGFMEEGSWSCDKALQAVTYTCVWGFNFIALKILIWSHFRIGYFKGCTVRIPSRLPMQPYNFFSHVLFSLFFFFPSPFILVNWKTPKGFSHTKMSSLTIFCKSYCKITVHGGYVFSCSCSISEYLN